MEWEGRRLGSGGQSQTPQIKTKGTEQVHQLEGKQDQIGRNAGMKREHSGINDGSCFVYLLLINCAIIFHFSEIVVCAFW